MALSIQEETQVLLFAEFLLGLPPLKFHQALWLLRSKVCLECGVRLSPDDQRCACP